MLCSPSLHQNLEEGGDSLSESANLMMPPPTTSLGNLSSLDITNDEELPTDPSNSSDTQEESECESKSHHIQFSLLLYAAVLVEFPAKRLTKCRNLMVTQSAVLTLSSLCLHGGGAVVESGGSGLFFSLPPFHCFCFFSPPTSREGGGVCFP